MNVPSDAKKLGYWYGIASVFLLGLFVVSLQLQDLAFDYLTPTVIILTLLLASRFVVWGIKHDMPLMWLWVPAFLFAPPVTNVVFWFVAWKRGPQ